MMRTSPTALGRDEGDFLNKALRRRLCVLVEVVAGAPFETHSGTWMRIVRVFLSSGLRAWSTPDEYFVGDLNVVVAKVEAYLRPLIERALAEDLAEALE